MLKIPWIELSHGEGIYTLRQAQGGLLQVLLSEFRMSRKGPAILLEVSFDGDAPTVRTSGGKAEVGRRMPGYPDRVPALQDAIDGVLFGTREFFHHLDTDFVFRYVSGGTLPIIENDGTRYYCLFYRDVFPVGWNIANGASDSLAELLNPILAVDRELREELMVFGLSQSPPLRFELKWCGMDAMRPESLDDRMHIERFLVEHHRIPSHFCSEPLEVTWNPFGPDTVRIAYEKEVPVARTSCYLSISATDYGIEVDRIAQMRLAYGMVLMDGEVTEHCPLNRPVGLFEVAKTQASVGEGGNEFLPDRLFHTATEILSCAGSADVLGNDIIYARHLSRFATERSPYKSRHRTLASVNEKVGPMPGG